LMRTARARQDRVLEPIEPEAEDEILQRVTLLLEQTGAFCTLLISSAGHLIAQAGITHGVDVNALAALVAANVAAMAEISRLLESKANFKSFFQEGEDFNIYSHIVNEEAILIVVARPDVKTGLIWLYARRAADELQETLQQIPMPSMEDLDIDALNAEFDNAFTFDEPQTKPAAPSKPKEIQPEPADDGDVDLLSLEDAIAKGLVPYELFGASEN